MSGTSNQILIAADSKKVVFRLSPDTIKNLKRIAVEKETSMNDLFVESCDLIIKKYKEFLK